MTVSMLRVLDAGAVGLQLKDVVAAASDKEAIRRRLARRV
jgi:hypothetical protein